MATGTIRLGDMLVKAGLITREQFDKALLNNLVDGMPKVARRLEVVRILTEFSAEKQAGVLAYLAGEAGSVQNVKSFWVLNAALLGFGVRRERACAGPGSPARPGAPAP